MHNSRNPAVKRLMREAKDLAAPTELYYAQPLEDNLFEWHFTIRGPVDSDFEGGVYHGRVLIPGDYPMKPPNIILLTPNGRFEINKKICLSISGYHPETWRPAWSIRTALLALVGFMPTHGLGAIGALEYPPEERRRLARQSRDWRCPICCPTPDSPSLESLLNPLSDASAKETEEARSLAKEISIAGEKPKESDDQQQQQQEGSEASELLQRSAASVPANISEPTPQPIQPPQAPLQPPMSFQEWLVRIKGFSEARARQLVESSETSQQQQQPQTANRPNPQVGGFYSILREEWTILALML
uniref:UBIQUITIN_CONJUGAT_2 domain-containing protein n=1 Tax=Macrostomum lignano TaxID=282301 RepID=A0A1I8GCM1_9PLAT